MANTPISALGSEADHLPRSISFANLQQNAQRVGFLLKHEKGLLKGLFGRSWKRKYCILSGYHFYFFKNKKGAGREKSNGVINLRYFDKCTAPTGKHANLPHTFCLASSQKSEKYAFVFQADSVDEQQRWMTDIQLVIFQCQTQGRTGQNASGLINQPRSQPASPVSLRADDPTRPRSSSIPESGFNGVYRSLSTGEERPNEDVEATAPPEAPVSRSESRNNKPDLLVPRMPKYNQVVSELQSKLNHVRTDTESPPDDHHAHQLSPRILSNAPSSRATTTSPTADSSGTASLSSYDNGEDERPLPPPPPAAERVVVYSSQTSRTITTPQKSPTGQNIDVQFDNVLRMMEKITDAEDEDGLVGPQYAIPFKNRDRPIVPPKPKREVYESLLSNHVTYQVSPAVDVSG